MMKRSISERCLQLFYPILGTIFRKRSLVTLFYLIVLFSAKEYIIAALKIAYVVLFASGPHKSVPSRELLQIQVIFKHGHRAPFRRYKTDPNPAEFWQEGLGMLTQLGRQQMYIVGKQLRNMYKDFLTHNPNEVYVQSSDAMRCMYSSYSLLAGLYPPDEEWTFNQGLPWQPIEVFYVPEDEEMYLQSNPNCHLYEVAKKQTANSKEVRDFVEEYKSFYEYLEQHSQKSVHTYDSAGDLYKTLSVESEYNLTIPEWALEHWDELIHQTDYGYYFHFKTRLHQRLRAGPLLGLMLQRMKDRIANLNNDIKLYGYSGHGSNTAAIQCALLAYDMKHSPHATTIVQELYSEGDGSYSTRIVLHNSTHPTKKWEDPYAMHLYGCPSTFCPLDVYEEFIQDVIPENWKKECEKQEEYPDDTAPVQRPVYIQLKNSARHINGSLFITILFVTLLCLLCDKMS